MNVIELGLKDGRLEVWDFPDGTKLTIEVPNSEPPITIKHAVYCLSSVLHGIHTGVLTGKKER